MVDFRHILAIPAPFYGHVYPILNLCCKLASRGCCAKVSILVHQGNVAVVENLRREMEANAELPQGALEVHAFAQELHNGFIGGVDGIRKLAHHLQEMGDFAAEAALQVAAMSKISCVLSDHQLGWAQDIADKLQVPRISLWICSFPEFALIHHMPKLMADGVYDPHHEDPRNCNKLEVPGYVAIPPSDVPQISNIPEARGLYWDFCLEQMSRAKEAEHVLVNSFYDLDREACDYLVHTMKLPVKLVGPLIPDVSSSADKDGCLPWLDKQPPKSVLYASFGTLVKMKAELVEEIYLGIEESMQRFLIVFRPDVLEEGDPARPKLASFLKRYMKSEQLRGKVVGWAPQQMVLQHPAVGGFFTHYGVNSVYEAMRAGVPMIGKPLLGDAIIVRRIAIDQWKVALDVDDDAETRHGVARAVAELIQDGDEVHSNIEKLKHCIQRTVQKGGETCKVLDELAGITDP